jgi:mycobactin peptide synthetase MbtE
MDAEISAAVTAAWLRVLRIESTDPDVGFFELGGDSLAAARVCAAIQSATGRRISLEQFAAAPTVNGLIDVVESVAPRRAERASAGNPAEPHAREGRGSCGES